jgi:hypothetical protein
MHPNRQNNPKLLTFQASMGPQRNFAHSLELVVVPIHQLLQDQTFHPSNTEKV